jgi:hypothetical protein
LTLRLRKIALTAHVSSSVGWMGTVAAFLALAAAGLRSEDPQLIRAAYLAMELTTWWVTLPLAAASILTGVVSSLGTTWGLFRYYWVVVKLLITLLSTGVLVMHLRAIERLGRAAAKGGTLSPDLHQAQVMMVVASSAALGALLLLTTLSLYKPRGLTPYGARSHRGDRAPGRSIASSPPASSQTVGN